MPLRPIIHFSSISDKRFITSRGPQLSDDRSRVDQFTLLFSQVFTVATPMPRRRSFLPLCLKSGLLTFLPSPIECAGFDVVTVCAKTREFSARKFSFHVVKV